MNPTRRDAALGLSAAIAASLATPATAAEDASLAAIERRHGGRLGVFALDTGSARRLSRRAGERFLMCSTFKTLAVAAVLARAEAGRERLERRIAFGEKDLLDYSPVTHARVADGAMTVRELCAAAIEASDNTAANLLMATFGGPATVTRYARRLGDEVTRLDRWEPTANDRDGDKDTTSPRAMAQSFRAVVLGRALNPASRGMLEGWLAAATPGLQRIRAGLPASWRAGDKAGSATGQTNDVAIIRPPGRAPLIVAAYYARPDGMAATAAEGVLREVGTIVTAWAG